MKYESSRGRVLSPSLSQLKNIQWTLPLRIRYSFLYKFFLLFLFSFYFCYGIYAEKKQTLVKSQLEINEIKTISNPNKRALKWVLYLFHLGNNYPQKITQQTAIAESLWSPNYSNHKAILLWTQVEIDRVQGNHKNATTNLITVIKILENTLPKSKIENQLLSLAYSTYARLSKWTNDKDGLPSAYKALDLAIKIDYPTGEVFARNLLGEIVGYNQKDFTLALEHFLKAKELLPQLPPDEFEIIYGFVLGNIAKTWSDLGEIEKSIAYKLQILAEGNIKNIYLLTGLYNNLGTNYYDLKKYDLAEKALLKTLDVMEEHQSLTNKGVPLLRLGLIQLEKDDLLGARLYADAIDLWLLKYKFIGNYEISFYQFKSKIAKAKQDYEQATYFLEKAEAEHTALHQMNSSNNIVKLETANKLRAIEQDRVLLEKERTLNQATIQRQKIILTIALFIALLSIYFSYLAYKKKNANQLNSTLASDEIKNTAPNTPNAKKIDDSRGPTTTIAVDTILKQKILTALSEDKLFLLQDLTLKNFADRINSNTSYVSQTINVGFEKNFNALINEYRIEEVLRLFQEGQHRTFTIESIYQKAGFKSKSSFQKAFKAKTGVTATHYLNRIS